MYNIKNMVLITSQIRTVFRGTRTREVKVVLLVKLTIYYVYEEKSETGELLSNVTIPEEDIQIIPVKSNLMQDRASKVIDMVDQAEGTYMTVLFEDDLLADNLLENACQRLDETDNVFVMPRIYPQFKLKDKCEHFMLKRKTDEEIDTREIQYVFPTTLHGVIFRTDMVQEAARKCNLECEREKQLIYLLFKKESSILFPGKYNVKLSYTAGTGLF